jgi:hypothetical protein
METEILRLFLIVGLVIFLYKFLTRNFKFFESRGVKFVEPKMVFGNMFGLFKSGENATSVLQYFYEKFKNEK